MNDYNLAKEMATDDIVISYLRDKEVARYFYRALCNNDWMKIPLSEEERIVDRLKYENPATCSYSWRAAGAIIAEIRNDNYGVKETYMDFYCSDFEGQILQYVRECLGRMGWHPIEYKDEEE